MSNAPGPLVVGYDGSVDADLALAWGVETARARNLSLEVVIVATQMDPVLGEVREHAERAAAEWAERAIQHLKAVDMPPNVVVRHGPTVPELLTTARNATMLVVGSRGHGIVAGSLTASVSQHLARHATCPVVVVRRPRDPDSHRIVVGMDGSPESGAALRFACELALAQAKQVVVIYGYRAFNTARGSLDDLSSSRTALRIDQAENLVASWAASAVPGDPGIEVVTEAIAVPPSRALIDGSAAASLVVVGSRGRDAFAHLMLGSVSQHVLHDAQCPVAVVR